MQEVPFEEVELLAGLLDIGSSRELDVHVAVDDGSQSRLVQLALCDKEGARQRRRRSEDLRDGKAPTWSSESSEC